MSLEVVYPNVRKTIVAFVAKYHAVPKKETPPPLFPHIFGTGFIVREDGWIATNDHVVRALAKAFRPPEAKDDEWGVVALLFHLTEQGQLEIPLSFLGVSRITEFNPGKAYYGPPRPDLGIVHVKARGLPVAEIEEGESVLDGMELATAGFPLGTEALTAPGWLHQITPTIQRGIVSAVLPFPCPTPHAFTINVMAQGGASGSPVFRTDTGKVVGVLYGGLKDLALTVGKDVCAVPTNISYVVPAHYIVTHLREMAKDKELVAPPDAQTLDEILQTKRIVNALEDGRRYEIKEIMRTPDLDRRPEALKPEGGQPS